jgi:hypothetical protein
MESVRQAMETMLEPRHRFLAYIRHPRRPW